MGGWHASRQMSNCGMQSHETDRQVFVLERRPILTLSLIRTQAETLPIVAVWIAGDGYAH